MANYPSSLPSFSGQVGTSTDPLSAPSHPTAHTNVNDEVVAIATELGTLAKGSFGTVRDRLAAALLFRFKAGYWYTSPFAGTAQSLMAESQMGLSPFWADGVTTFDRIAIEIVTTAGSTGALIRLGRYNADAGGYPSSLIADDGTVDATILSATTPREITISWTPAAGLYYLAAVCQGGATTKPTIRSLGATTVIPWVGTTSSAVAAATSGYNQAGVTAGLPSNVTAGASGASATPAIRLRAA